MKFKTIRHVHNYLNELPQFQNLGEKAARFDLNRFRNFCEAIGNPQADFPAIHVAGTNGKGSTCQILASIYQEAGYEVGLYTSPHLMDFRERFQIGGTRITEEELLAFFRQHEVLIKTFRLSYFELSTAIAFWWFSTRKVELAIIEVGLGGRLDATNVIVPVLSLITNISLDHTGILGTTLREIAREKAGIIKDGIAVISGNMPREARVEIKEMARRHDCPFYDIALYHPQWDHGECSFSVDGNTIRLQTDLIHPVQAFNVALAWQAVSILQNRFPVSDKFLRKGLENVRKNYQNSGRFEKLHPDLEWYFDGAHNPDAVAALVNMVSTLKPVDETILVLSIMKDKLNRSVVEEFQKFKKIYYYRLGNERAAGYNDVKEWMPEIVAFPKEGSSKERFLKELESELVIFAGSFYFYPTVRKWLQSSSSVY